MIYQTGFWWQCKTPYNNTLITVILTYQNRLLVAVWNTIKHYPFNGNIDLSNQTYGDSMERVWNFPYNSHIDLSKQTFGGSIEHHKTIPLQQPYWPIKTNFGLQWWTPYKTIKTIHILTHQNWLLVAMLNFIQHYSYNSYIDPLKQTFWW